MFINKVINHWYYGYFVGWVGVRILIAMIVRIYIYSHTYILLFIILYLVKSILENIFCVLHFLIMVDTNLF